MNVIHLTVSKFKEQYEQWRLYTGQPVKIRVYAPVPDGDLYCRIGMMSPHCVVEIFAIKGISPNS